MERMGRYIGGLFAALFVMVTLQVHAAEQVGRNFNHATTGFPLSGGHVAAACETCHVGGVFKGTPRNCDGCHAVGQRVVATPKNDKHIVTDAPCETCHFNTATWLGARYNHGSAVVGQCRNCHNGRQAAGKPGSHNAGKKATESCDSCHRTFAWTPASWNHRTGGNCDQAGCHLAGQNTWYKGMTTAHTRTGMATYTCQSCHNYVTWSPAPYNHSGAGGVRCDSCHNETVAVGPNHYGAHPVALAGEDCSQCHINNTNSWRPALGAKPSNHIPYNAGTACTACHLSVTSVRTGAAMHTYTSTFACTTCHLKNNPYVGWRQDTKNYGHEGWSTGDCSQSGCHRPVGSKGTSYITWD